MDVFGVRDVVSSVMNGVVLPLKIEVYSLDILLDPAILQNVQLSVSQMCLY